MNNSSMMRNNNNIGRETLLGSLNHHRRGHSLNGVSNHEDNLDLFSKNRRSLSMASSDDSSDVSVKLGRLSVGAAKPVKNGGIDDLLSSTEGGKHDYDWLLTPPGTPVFPSSEGESQPTLVPPRRSLTRSTSTTKASRLSVSQSENNNHTTRPARSSSVTRSSISTTSHSQYSSYSSNRNTSILNTSSASVSSYIRPSSPVTRSSSTARPSTPSSRPTASSRSSTPSRARSVSSTAATTPSSADRHRPSSQSSRPSTPSSRPHIPANLHSPSTPTPTRSLSRPSTPTRRNSLPSLSSSPSPASVSSTSASRVSLNGRNSAPASRPSSPSPRVRPPSQPVVPPDFPLETPPNLRTTLPDRPVSAGRSRPGAATMKGNSSDTQASTPVSRRHSSPIVSRGRLTEPAAPRSRGYGSTNGHHSDVPEPRKVQHSPEIAARKSVRPSTPSSTDNSGFGRSISKKSLDMAIKHMDIRNGSGNHRSLSNTTLFPQSIRNSNPKSHRISSSPASVDMNGTLLLSSNNGASNYDVGNDTNNRNNMLRGRELEERIYSSKLMSEVDIYESSRYDAMLLKEDLKNTNWLHSADDKNDQGLIFDNGFEHLPEPFGLL